MSTRYRGGRREVRSLDAFIKLMRASDSVEGYVAAGLAGSGVTPGQLALLEALLHLGPMTQRELSAKLLRSGANTTAVLDGLEQREFVTRTRRDDDRRCIEVALTAAGRRAIEGVFPAHARRIADAFESLSPPEQDDLARLCKKLGLGVSSRHRDAETTNREKR